MTRMWVLTSKHGSDVLHQHLMAGARAAVLALQCLHRLHLSYQPVRSEIQTLHKPVILTSTVKGITVNKGYGFQRPWNAWAKEHNEYSGAGAGGARTGQVGRRGRGGSGNLCHQRCSFFIWTSRAQQYCLRRGTRMKQESIIQPGNSIFSCLILLDSGKLQLAHSVHPQNRAL